MQASADAKAERRYALRDAPGERAARERAEDATPVRRAAGFEAAQCTQGVKRMVACGLVSIVHLKLYR